jgi:hypothetical protein
MNMYSSNMTWFKAYTIPVASSSCRYMPLREMHDGRKLLFHCSFDEGQSLALQIYDRRTNTCTKIIGAPHDLGDKIGLCSFGLDHPVARFLDQIVAHTSGVPGEFTRSATFGTCLICMTKNSLFSCFMAVFVSNCPRFWCSEATYNTREIRYMLKRHVKKLIIFTFYRPFL